MQELSLTEIMQHFGHSQTRLAEQLGVSRQAVHLWFKNDKIPPLRIYQLKDIMNNKSQEVISE